MYSLREAHVLSFKCLFRQAVDKVTGRREKRGKGGGTKSKLPFHVVKSERAIWAVS